MRRFHSVADLKDYLATNPASITRVLMVPGHSERQEIREMLLCHPEVEMVRLSRLWPDLPGGPLPNIHRLWEALQARISEVRSRGKIPCVLGVSAYLRLRKSTDEFWNILRRQFDSKATPFLVLLDEFMPFDKRREFKPYYDEVGSLLGVDDSSCADGSCPAVAALVSREWLGQVSARMLCGSCCLLSGMEQYLELSEEDSWDSVLNRGEDAGEEQESANSANLRLVIPVTFNKTDDVSQRFPGLNEEIDQITSLKGFMDRFYDLKDLSDEAVEWVYRRWRELQDQPGAMAWRGLDLIARCLDLERSGVRDLLSDAPRFLCEAQPTVAAVFINYLRPNVPQASYLARVLATPGCDAISFLSLYVLLPLQLLEDASTVPRQSEWAEERRRGLNAIGYGKVKGYLQDFLSQGKDLASISVWLNNGLDAEAEFIIAHFGDALENVIPNNVLNAIPLLSAYLTPYDLRSDYLNEYFTEYRSQKLANRVTEDFICRAGQASIPYEVRTRNDCLNRYRDDAHCYLIVVDAMSVEYLPLLLELARQNNLGVAGFEVAMAQLPSSTRFNTIAWVAERRQDIKSIDNIAHDGTVRHEAFTPEACLWRTLTELESRVVPAVKQALKSYRRVVVTADHGASRLAVLAYNLRLVRSLKVPEGGESPSGRYVKYERANPNESLFSASSGYLCLKGYNRFSVPGNMAYSLHGGATLEEQLVPLLVFERSASVYIPPATEHVPSIQDQVQPEIEEDADFDF